ncbi:Conserved protein containing a Zn-ribbon-like motif, possibly RNA-binding [Goodfellowiella coeruleoviolacea]|uniref:Conserved protein containing a Zn-ribbon-like motif, possibly RNA-binding n=1 Tax=Goodfellowiella coeruleoviolacea TaxID=334858 RepID=A0AAE3GAQ0_9PSEU|nr:Conserved protein containing a Zn-ribbon-like motif, possibly RNA-binding [Goodfellowiella coeruleoviolacea]
MVTTKDLRRAGFPFRSGALCLDFVGTLAKRGMGDRELLGGPAELAVWLRAAGLPPTSTPLTDQHVARAREFRESIHELARCRVAGRALPRRLINLVNDTAQVDPPPVLLGRDGESLVPPGALSFEAVLSIIARDAISLFGGPHGHHIRVCLGHDCSLYFVDRSRPGSRRWCVMAACGEKASSATYRRRHASAVAGGAERPDPVPAAGA